MTVLSKFIGNTVGQAGSALNFLTSSNWGQGLRDYGGQLTGGHRSINLVTDAYAAPATQVLGTSSENNPQTYNVTPYSGGALNLPGGLQKPTQTYGNIPSVIPPDFSYLNQQQQDYGSLIDEEYNNQIRDLANQESGLRGQASSSSGQVGTEFENVKAQLGNEQATNEQGVQANLSTAEKEAGTNLSDARRLFQETQQRNIAQLSGLGISSSSVAEALAERLGVETAKRIAGITGSISEIRQNATKEISRIKDYYQGRITTLQQEKTNKLADIQGALMEGLNKINSARDMAATAKRQARMDLYYKVQDQKNALQQDYEKFKMSLADWYVKKQSALQPLTASDYADVFESQLSKLQQAFNPTQFNYSPEVSIDPYGRFSGRIGISNKKDQLNQTQANPEDVTYWNQ